MGSKIQTSDFKIKIALIIFKGKKISFCDNKKDVCVMLYTA